MRLLIAFFGFFALALAPLATPVAAAVAIEPCAAAMSGAPGHHHHMPTEHDGKAAMANCCLAVCAAALMRAERLETVIAARLPAFPATNKSFLGHPGEVATPPPRTV